MTHHHQHADDAHATVDTPGAAYDPVCGHWVDPARAPARAVTPAGTIHFCSLGCSRAFGAAPARFLPRFEQARVARRATALPEAAPSARMGFLDKIRPAATPGAAIDPVCHMKVDPARAAGKTEHEGATYYFCAPGCKAKFEADPKKYLAGGGGGAHEM